MDATEPKTRQTTADELLTLAEVTAILRVSLGSVYTWIREGKLPAIRVGNNWRVKRGDLDGWLDGQRNVEVPA